MLVMTGTDPGYSGDNTHLIRSEDGIATVWSGVIDDLWKLGRPAGSGGPWYKTPVEEGNPSDPYLIGFFDKRTLELSHQSGQSVTFTVEVDPVGNGPWMVYLTVDVEPGEAYRHRFPDHFQCRWIRFRTDRNTTATAWLEYR
jgi:hypothetical protein